MRPDPVAMICYPTIGGSARIATELAGTLARGGMEVHLISYERPWRLDDAVVFHRVDVLEYPLLRYPPYDQALATKVVDLHETHGVRLFHAHYAVPHGVAVSLADQILGGGELRLVTTLHGTDITLVGSDPAYRRAVLFGLERSHLVTAVSESLVADTRRLIGFEGDIRVIPNFVDPAAFRAGSQPRWPDRPPGPRRIVHLSTFRPVKQILQLCEAFTWLRERVDVRLTLVGDGPDREAAFAFFEAAGCKDEVALVGSQDDPAPFLADADLYMFSSRKESFGLGVLEAMASGVPVVGPRVGGVPEVLGNAGALVEPGSPAALGEAALALLTDAASYRAAAAEGRARAVGVFARDLVVPGYVEAYQAALNEPR